MSMGKRVRERQPEMWMATTNFPTAASHPFYTRLNQRLRRVGHGEESQRGLAWGIPLLAFEKSPADKERDGWAARLGTVVRYNSHHFAVRRQFHEFSGACSLLICVVEHDAAYAAKHVLETEVEFRVGFQALLKVSSQVWLPGHLAIRRPQKTGGNWRDQLDCIVIVRHDQVQIVSVPSLNPMIGQTPSFVSRHCRSLRLYHNGRTSWPYLGE